MSRILDSMKARVAKLEAKITPLVKERADLLQAIALLEPTESTPPAADDTAAATTEAVKEQPPVFQEGHTTGEDVSAEGLIASGIDHAHPTAERSMAGKRTLKDVMAKHSRNESSPGAKHSHGEDAEQTSS